MSVSHKTLASLAKTACGQNVWFETQEKDLENDTLHVFGQLIAYDATTHTMRLWGAKCFRASERTKIGFNHGGDGRNLLFTFDATKPESTEVLSMVKW